MNKQYTEGILNDATANYDKYIRDGARTTPGPEVVPGRGGDGQQQRQEQDPDPRQYVPRRPAIRLDDFDRHGYTAGCPECSRMQTGVGNRRPHNARCRSRLEGAINACLARQVEGEHGLQGHAREASDHEELAEHAEEQYRGEAPGMDIDRVDIAEVSSLERVAKAGEKYNFKAGGSMDLKTGWDFTKKEDRDRAWQLICRDRPRLSIGRHLARRFQNCRG